MKIIEGKFNCYGEEDYDASYINWGFDDLYSGILMVKEAEGRTTFKL